MSDDIELRKVGEVDIDSLPRGVKAIIFADKIVFARRTAGRFVPLSDEEQERLRKKHVK